MGARRKWVRKIWLGKERAVVGAALYDRTTDKLPSIISDNGGRKSDECFDGTIRLYPLELRFTLFNIGRWSILFILLPVPRSPKWRKP